jgi:hypothetical protein
MASVDEKGENTGTGECLFEDVLRENFAALAHQTIPRCAERDEDGWRMPGIVDGHVTAIVHATLTEMMHAMDLPLPDSSTFPRGGFLQEQDAHMLGAYSFRENMIYIHPVFASVEKYLGAGRGDPLGEELGHYLRSRSLQDNPPPANMLMPRIEEEFFGYVGRLVLARVAEVRNCTPLLFPHGKVRAPKKKSDVLKALRPLRNRFFHRHPWLRWLRPFVPIDAKTKKRIDTITHSRGYQWGARINVQNIADWGKFWSLPFGEARKRFFREDPDYRGL